MNQEYPVEFTGQIALAVVGKVLHRPHWSSLFRQGSTRFPVTGARYPTNIQSARSTFIYQALGSPVLSHPPARNTLGGEWFGSPAHHQNPYRIIATLHPSTTLFFFTAYVTGVWSIALFLRRWADGCSIAPSSDLLSGRSLAQVTSSPTDDNDDDFIERPDLFHRTLGFPESSPTLFDLLRLPVASVVCDQTPDNIPCIFFAETILRAHLVIALRLGLPGLWYAAKEIYLAAEKMSDEDSEKGDGNQSSVVVLPRGIVRQKPGDWFESTVALPDIE
ncbi:hypothetical protein B0H14DRAFT_2577368 [Mycena olivaceomarginata]|nr:hypothetical protein B0H14DRAFT_2577368 [Mycena olivaceomarginata]